MVYRAGVTTKSPFSINIPLLVLTVVIGFLVVATPSLVEKWVNRNGSVPKVGGAVNQIDLSPQSISLSRQILLKGNTLPPESGEALLRVAFTEQQIEVISNNNVQVQYHVSANELRTFGFDTKRGVEFTSQVSAEDFDPGVYNLVVTIGDWQSTSLELTVTYPLYVTWTFDWEGYDVKQEHLDTIVRQSNEHEIPLTHFFNPRIYTNPNLSPARAQELTNWVIARRDVQGDDIGLHLHMQPDMVRAAGVEVQENAARWGSNLKDGYDVLTSEYSYGDMVKMLNWSKSMFKSRGLGTPIMYRAGGWYADEEILQAVHDTGFALDSSARTEYAFGHGHVAGHWNIAADQSPYRLNLNDQNDVNGTSGLWEFPNTGADSWSFTAAQMIERFELQHGQVLTEPHVVTFLSHPEWYNVDAPKMDQVLAHTDQFLHSADRGNVVYATLSAVYTVWENK